MNEQGQKMDPSVLQFLIQMLKSPKQSMQQGVQPPGFNMPPGFHDVGPAMPPGQPQMPPPAPPPNAMPQGGGFNPNNREEMIRALNAR